MRTITQHHDGHGLNESIVITTDTPNSSGAAHKYDLSINGDAVGLIQFQEGPRNVAGSIAGVTEAALLAVLIDRLEGFQAGPYACYENAMQLSNLYACLSLTKARADERAKRGVLGKNAK